MRTIYRLLSTCAGLGYGFPEESFAEAMKLKLDLIAADAGSMDPGPYYLGTGTSYAERLSLKRDFAIMLRGALAQGCPLIIGSCGLAGDTPNLMLMVDIAQEVFRDLEAPALKVALIDGTVPNEVLLGHVGDLVPLGTMPGITEKDILQCKKVGQMGIAPYMTALNEGAQVILAGRSCDVAIFAADPVRRGLDTALAFHAGHILECGAIACDPGSGSDCLLAEFRDDNTVVFTPPNRARKATTYSIAAHSLYEEDHPSLQFYPEGVLSFEKTDYFKEGDSSAGIRNSEFFRKPLTIKVEGSRKTGERYVSVLFCSDAGSVPEQYPVYGRNGVEPAPAGEGEREIGLLIKAASTSEETAKNLLTIWKGLLMHYGYEGRRSTAGNLAFPLSPSQLTFRDQTGRFVSFVVAGTRDPFFREKLGDILHEIQSRVALEYPEMAKQGTVEIILGTEEEPFVYLDTIGPTREEALESHNRAIQEIESLVHPGPESIRAVYAGQFFEWGLYHLFTNAEGIRTDLFPVTLYRWDGSSLNLEKRTQPLYTTLQVDDWATAKQGDVDMIAPVTGLTPSPETRPLVEMASIIRSKNAGINKLTYDIFFNSREAYEVALNSNCFTREGIAKALRIPVDRVIGTYRADVCTAIKISVHRAVISGSRGDRDVFGAQQHASLLALRIPANR